MQNKPNLSEFIAGAMDLNPTAAETDYYIKTSFSRDPHKASHWDIIRANISNKETTPDRLQAIVYKLSRHPGERMLNYQPVYDLAVYMHGLNGGVFTPEIVSLLCWAEHSGGVNYLLSRMATDHDIGRCIKAIKEGDADINTMYEPRHESSMNVILGRCLMRGWGVEQNLYMAFIYLHEIDDDWKEYARPYIEYLKLVIPSRPEFT